MNNKKIGTILILFSAVLGLFFLNHISKMNSSYTNECNPSQECVRVGSLLNWSHFFVGILFSILSLGIYLIFFTREEEILFEKLEKESIAKTEEEKLNLIMKALDENEAKVIRVIKEQPGITQNTLTIKTGLSKAKISNVLSDFENKKLVYRQPKGKTYSIFLAE